MKYKVAFTGAQGSGKTSLIQSLLDKPFVVEPQGTVIDAQTHEIKHKESEISLIDVTAHPAHSPQSLKSSESLDLIIYCADLSEKINEAEWQKYHEAFQTITSGHEFVPVIVVGTKQDEQDKKIGLCTNFLSLLIVTQNNFVCLPTSAKKKRNINELLDAIANVEPNKRIDLNGKSETLQSALNAFIDNVKQAPKLTPVEKRLLEFEAQLLGHILQSERPYLLHDRIDCLERTQSIIENSQLQDKPKSKLKLAISSIALVAAVTLGVGAIVTLSGLTFGLAGMIAIASGLISGVAFAYKQVKNQKQNQGFFKEDLNLAVADIKVDAEKVEAEKVKAEKVKAEKMLL